MEPATRYSLGGLDAQWPITEALPLHGLRRPLRRPDRHRPGRSSPTAARLGAVPLPYGPEPLEPADRPGAEPRPPRRAAHDRAAAPRLSRPSSARPALATTSTHRRPIAPGPSPIPRSEPLSRAFISRPA